jgi:coenzyme F420 hydrogenase subunit beta
MHDCDLASGRCYAYCPRTEVDWETLQSGIFGKEYRDIEIGTARQLLMGRAIDRAWEGKVQNGGVVSALTDLAIREGLIHSAILTRRDADFLPQGKQVSRREEIMACSGSGYVSGPTLAALNQGNWPEDKALGIIGLPCQVLALAKMRLSTLEARTPIHQIALVIGLFCTWALDYKPFTRFLRQRFEGLPVEKLDITPPPERLLRVWVGGGRREISLDEIKPFVRPACRVCPDMTSEFADLSVGTVEGLDGWNTVIVRTDRGEALVDLAQKKNTLETRPLPRESIEHLREASLLKKQRALEGLQAPEGAGRGYLKLSSVLREKIIEENR